MHPRESCPGSPANLGGRARTLAAGSPETSFPVSRHVFLYGRRPKMAKLNPNFPGHFRSPLIYFDYIERSMFASLIPDHSVGSRRFVRFVALVFCMGYRVFCWALQKADSDLAGIITLEISQSFSHLFFARRGEHGGPPTKSASHTKYSRVHTVVLRYTQQGYIYALQI